MGLYYCTVPGGCRGRVEMKVKQYYLGSPSAETQRLLQQQQREADSYNTLSPEQVEAELNKDSGYKAFLDSLDEPVF